MGDLVEHVGCIHLHSTYSDGSGDVADLVTAAQGAGLDYLILTDHHTMKARYRSVEGRYGNVLLLTGTELGRHKGHVLAMNIRRNVRDRPADTRRICRQILAQGGLAFIAHPCGHGNRLLLCRDHSWKSPNMPLVTGLEVWSWMYDWFEGLRWQGDYLPAYLWPERRVTGPSRKTLALWDRLSARRRCVGLGCLDVHALRKWLFPGVVVFSYDYLFRSVCTHILAPSATGNVSTDKRALYDALARGRVFFAHHRQGNPRGFVFEAHRAGEVLQQGDELSWDGGPVAFRVRAPLEGEIRLLRDGAIMSTVTGTEVAAQAPGPGAYRVEVRRQQRPWIFSNPIHLRDNGPDDR